jgi:DNA-directed RNA polymerase subunit K/omega
MQETPLDKLMDRTGSMYKLVNLTSLRAIELGEGAHNLVDAKPDANIINTALKEILEGKITIKIKEAKD